MIKKCQLRIARADFEILFHHLFPGDKDEHGAVLLAGLSQVGEEPVLLIREVHLAIDGIDYVEGTIGYRQLTAQFIHRYITRARDERLVYLAVHNHDSDWEAGFSSIDIRSHERGYPALLQIARGMPVGALVFGKRAIEADLWLPGGSRLSLDQAVVIGNTIRKLTPGTTHSIRSISEIYERQTRMFGKEGQAELNNCTVGIIGLGGIGSILAEYLSRLGVGEFYLVDGDHVEESNLSRVVGALPKDAEKGTLKVAVAERLIKMANPSAIVNVIADDFARKSVSSSLLTCDYLFLAADSMRARLMFNAIVHQYLIPGVQLGSKVCFSPKGTLTDILSLNRPVRPGHGCLWCNQLIDTTTLAKESKTDEERKQQAYGVEEPNPSVISLNAIAAAHAVNDFLLNYLDLRPEATEYYYEQFQFLTNKRTLVIPRLDSDCSECSATGLRFARGDSVDLPYIEG